MRIERAMEHLVDIVCDSDIQRKKVEAILKAHNFTNESEPKTRKSLLIRLAIGNRYFFSALNKERLILFEVSYPKIPASDFITSNS